MWRGKHALGGLLCLGLLLPGTVCAQWPSDAAVDLALADGAVPQQVPHSAATADGGCYVGWFANPALGEFQVYLQRLTPSGEEVFPHGGILVSDHPTDSWVMDWDLIVDRDGNAVLAFTDLRSGEFDVQIYKISPGGEFLWGADGISLTENETMSGAPRLAEASDGDLVVVWNEGNSVAAIMMQRLSPAGELRYAAGGIQVGGKPGDFAFGPDVVAAEDGHVIVAWIPDSDLDKDRHLAARKFDAAGLPLWTPEVSVFDSGNIPIGNLFELTGDGAGGALLCWTKESNLFFDCHVQHLDAAGLELWPHDGLNVFPGFAYEVVYPSLNRDPDSGELYVFCRSQTTSQNYWGLQGQKLSAGGDLLWGDGGRQLMPIDDTYEAEPHGVVLPSGDAVVLFLQHAPLAYRQKQVRALRLDGAGNFVWPTGTVTVASTLSDKLDLLACPGQGGAITAVWQDNRSDAGDILGKSLNPDGTLGDGVTPVVPSLGIALSGGHPNPFNPRTEIAFTLDRARDVRLAVHDLRGRQLARLAAGTFGPGEHRVWWDGVADGGRALPSGQYVVRLSGSGFARTVKLTLAK